MRGIKKDPTLVNYSDKVLIRWSNIWITIKPMQRKKETRKKSVLPDPAKCVRCLYLTTLNSFPLSILFHLLFPHNFLPSSVKFVHRTTCASSTFWFSDASSSLPPTKKIPRSSFFPWLDCWIWPGTVHSVKYTTTLLETCKHVIFLNT